MLKPDSNIQRFVISSPVTFCGEYSSEDINVSIMFEKTISTLCHSGQKFYMVSILTRDNIRGDVVRVYPNYTYYSDVICMCMSVLYGKAIYNHGFIEENGVFRQPDMLVPQIIHYDNDVYSNSPRKDLEIPFNFEKINLITHLLKFKGDSKAYISLINAARFYWRALHNIEKDAELAFIDLVSCGEALASGYKFSMDDLIKHDDKLCNIINMIKKEEIDSDVKKNLCNFMRSRLYQVKRKYILAIFNSLNDYFFSNTESKSNGRIGRIQRNNVEKNISCTYDLRSKYIHEGLYLGDSLKELRNWKNEVEMIASINDDKMLKNTFTLHGLERVMRYCLLVYIHNKLGISLDKRLCVDKSILH